LTSLVITRPDDWHLHLRDGDMLATVLPDTAARFARAIVMPNLSPPVTTARAVAEYRERIVASLPDESDFEPLMTLYLTEETSPQHIADAVNSGIVFGVKLYPAGATTHSDAGVTDLSRCHDALAAMAEAGMPLLVHGEVTDPAVDIFDREQRFIEAVLVTLADTFPSLKIVLEHITTADAVEFVQSARQGIAATVTPQHLLLNRNALFEGGLRPHRFCLPVLKAERHRRAVVEAATSGSPRFFLGTDSAPHPKSRKESDCGCAGVYSAHAGIELYAEAFADVQRLDRLEAFASHHGADFYGLPRNRTSITLVDDPWQVPDSILVRNGERIVPFRAGLSIRWRVAQS
jgi:dihydroorotase